MATEREMADRMNDEKYQVLIGDNRETLRTLPDASVQCVVTSPPYYGLRDYGNDGQIGLESTPDEYVATLVDVFREVRRVLRDDGTVWLNLGDSYWNNYGGGSETMTTGNAAAVKQRGRSNKPKSIEYKIKDLIGIPWMVANALREPIYRCSYCGVQKRISQWARWDNGSFQICGSCGKRCLKQPDKVSDGWYLRQDIIWHKPNPMPESVTDRCTKAHEYVFLLSKSAQYFYNAEAVKEAQTYTGGRGCITSKSRAEAAGRKDGGRKEWNDDGKRNRRSVWTIATQPYRGAHFATFPPKLIEPCILAGSREGDTVLDPFGGSGTTAGVALEHGRKAILCELSEDYAALIPDRINSITDAMVQRRLL